MADTFGRWNHQNSTEIGCVVHRFDAFNRTVYIAIRSAVNQITLNSKHHSRTAVWLTIHLPANHNGSFGFIQENLLYEFLHKINKRKNLPRQIAHCALFFLSCCCLLFCFSVHLLCFASSRSDFSRNIFRFLFDWKPFFLSIFNREWAPVLFYSVDLMRVIALLRKKNRQPFSIEKCIRRQGENHLYSRNTCSCIAITFALRGAKIS